MKNSNKILKIIFILSVTLAILLLINSCTKTYTIKATSSGVNDYELEEAEKRLSLAKLLDSEILIFLAEKEIAEIKGTPDKVETYKASKIIDFSNTSVRFIDNNGNEKFVTADRIEIRTDS